MRFVPAFAEMTRQFAFAGDGAGERMNFHEVRLPARLAFGSTGGVERRTEVVTLGSGFERRSTPWAHGRRRYLIGAGLRSLDDMAALTAFFEARRGRLFTPVRFDTDRIEVTLETFEAGRMAAVGLVEVRV